MHHTDCRETVFIKVKPPGKKKFLFLAGSGLNHLKIHATPFFADKVEETLRVLREDNPGYEFRIQN